MASPTGAAAPLLPSTPGDAAQNTSTQSASTDKEIGKVCLLALGCLSTASSFITIGAATILMGDSDLSSNLMIGSAATIGLGISILGYLMYTGCPKIGQDAPSDGRDYYNPSEIY